MFAVGIIGLGHVAVHHIAAIELSNDFRLVAGCDPDGSRHLLLPENTATYSDAKDLIECEGLDVIVVASPNQLHVDHGIQVMQSGRWLFVEKPLARTPEEFERFANEKAALDGRCTQALHAAFGVEVDWYAANQDVERIHAGDLVGFSADFSDPYIVGGQVIRHGPTAWGSWMDSGINALSVIARLIDPRGIQFRGADLARDPNADNLAVEARVDFGFPTASGDGVGTIVTTWKRGADKKVTVLRFSEPDRELVLDHSDQTAVFCQDGEDKLVFSCDNELPRLTNHYISAFADLASQMNSGVDNFEHGRALHELVFQAENA